MKVTRHIERPPTVDPATAWHPYRPTKSAPWNATRAAHLFRRAGFGETRAKIDRAVTRGVDATLDQLFDLSEAPAIDQEMTTSARLLTGNADAKPLAA